MRQAKNTKGPNSGRVTPLCGEASLVARPTRPWGDERHRRLVGDCGKTGVATVLSTTAHQPAMKLLGPRPSRPCYDPASHRGAPHPKSRGFSLIELLAVIGIISVLISMLLPTLRVARQVSERTQCASQLRQVGMAFQMYANANQGWLPSWRHWRSIPGWCGKLAAFLPPESLVYHCPSFPGRALNCFICAKWASTNRRYSTKFSDVTMTTRFVISGDVTQPLKYLPPFGTMQASDRPSNYNNTNDFAVPCVCFLEDGGFLMHRGGNNVLFDDLHVDCFAHFDPVAMTFHPNRMLSWQGVESAGPDVPSSKPAH